MNSAASVLDVPRGLRGSQRPRILLVPDRVSSTGQEAIELAAMAGLEADDWQSFVIDGALGEQADGRWSARRVGVEVPRQNGKGGILEIRKLAGLFLLREPLIVYSAHEFATAEQALNRMAALIEGTPRLSRELKKNGIKRSHGQEGIYLKTGQELRYKTRTKGGGRGFTADCVILDEAMNIPEAMHSAMYPTLRAVPNPQVWYTGSAVDQESMEHGVVFARVREAALSGDAKGLAYFGWSPPFDKPTDIPAAALRDPDVWAMANPALGIRIDPEYMAEEVESMDPRSFAVELLGVGDWPRVEGEDGSKVSVKAWLGLVDPGSKRSGPVWFAFDVEEDRSGATISAAGRRDDGLFHVEVVDQKRGTDWVVDRLAALEDKHQPEAILYGRSSPAASLEKQLENANVRVTPVNANEEAQACGVFYDAVEQRTVRHLGTAEMAQALKGAETRAMGDAWAWSRKNSKVGISPVVASTFALWGSVEEVTSGEPTVWVFG